MSKPYKYSPETETISNGECTMHVMQEMPEWEGKDLYEDIHFETDLSPDNHLLGIAIPKKFFFSKIKSSFQPTHFIEQYNTKDEFKARDSKHFVHTPPNDISQLPHYLEATANCNTIHTVAIFKIQFKKSA